MKAVIFVFIFVIGVVLAFFGVGALLPKATHVERSIDINASAGVVFSLVSNHKDFQRWSPWTALDPDIKVEYSGPSDGLGATMTWSGNDQVGVGTSIFVEYLPNSRAVVSLDFGPMGQGEAAYDISESPEGVSTITWSFDTVHASILPRYFGLIMDGILGEQYERGLVALKALSESLPPIKTEEVTYEVDGVSLTGFLAYPVGLLDPVPGVVIVHEWWGHNAFVRERAAKLAEMGFTALALDMYGDGKLASHPDDAMTFMQEVGAGSAVAESRFDAAVDLLKQHRFTDRSRIGAIGYCFGGAVALNMARSGRDLKGVVSFHGALGGLNPVAENASAKVLVLNGEDDPFVPVAHREQFKASMDAAAFAYEFVDYPGVVHAFTNPSADEYGEQFELPLKYDEQADADSWARMESFLNKAFY